MVKAKDITESYMKWIVGNCEFNFWKEHWVLDGKLKDNVEYPSELGNMTVAETITNDEWAGPVQNQFSFHMLNTIKAQLLNASTSFEDRCIWTLVTNGSFSVETAWEVQRVKANFLGFGKKLWHYFVPLK